MKPVLLDGSCGSALWASAEREGIAKVPTWIYTIEHPELVLELHKDYIQAGSEMIQTNTFCVNGPSVARSSSYSVEKLVRESIELAKEAARNTQVKVYVSSGPLNVLLEPYGDLSEDECRDIYHEVFQAARAGKADMIMLETFMDLAMAKIAAEEAVKTDIPVACSMTFEKCNRTMMGDKIQDICDTLSSVGVASVGMNCSYGPVEAIGVIEEFAQYTKLPLYFKPNAGMGASYGPEQFANEIKPALGFVKYVGGCCGTDKTYISALKKAL